MENLEITYNYTKERESLDRAILFVVELADRLSSAVKVIEEHKLQTEIECYDYCLEEVVPVCGEIRGAKEALRLAEDDLNGMTKAINRLKGGNNE